MTKLRRSVVAAVLACSTLGGCSTVPRLVLDPRRFNRSRGLPTSSITSLARSPDLQDLSTLKSGKYLATVLLTLQVDDTIDFTPSLAETQLIPKPATLQVVTTLSGDIGGARRRTFTSSYSIDLTQLGSSANCRAASEEKLYDLRGDLGLSEIIADGLASQNDGLVPGGSDSAIITAPKSATDKSGPSFGSTVQFIVTNSMTAFGPVWTLKYFKGPGGNTRGADQRQAPRYRQHLDHLRPLKGRRRQQGCWTSRAAIKKAATAAAEACRRQTRRREA